MARAVFDTEVLLSTYEDRIFDVLERVRSWAEVSFVLIVHQTKNGELSDFISKKVSEMENVRYIVQREYGVAKSRNLALNCACTDILLFCDDDVELLDGFQNTLRSSFVQNPQAAAITFPVKDLDGDGFTKNFSTKSFTHNKFSILKVGTIEIAVKRECLLDSRVKFPEDLGAGALLPVCDEPVFLSRLLDIKKNVIYIPVPIVAHEKESSGLEIDTFNKLKSRMVCFKYIFGDFLGRILFIAFSIKKAHSIRKLSWVVDCFVNR